MAENANIEIAKHLHEHGAEHGRRHEQVIEIVEAVLLAIVAILTAWSGYQSAKWDGESAKLYAESSRTRAESVQLSLQSGQVLVYNAGTFNSWLQARVGGDTELAALLVRRMTPEYRTAFFAWLKTNPLHNPNAPPGPRYMPEFKDPLAAKATTLSDQATEEFNSAVNDRSTGEHFVRLTVVFAAILFLIAVGQRFKVRNVRVAVLGVAGAFLLYGIVVLASYPQA
jgi:heme/copper-type cytochrome/quinol oxidase subunit 4